MLVRKGNHLYLTATNTRKQLSNPNLSLPLSISLSHAPTRGQNHRSKSTYFAFGCPKENPDIYLHTSSIAHRLLFFSSGNFSAPLPLSLSLWNGRMRKPCCDKQDTNKGAWSKQEDQKLIDYIRKHGEGCWRTLPKAAGTSFSLASPEFVMFERFGVLGKCTAKQRLNVCSFSCALIRSTSLREEL